MGRKTLAMERWGGRHFSEKFLLLMWRCRRRVGRRGHWSIGYSRALNVEYVAGMLTAALSRDGEPRTSCSGRDNAMSGDRLP